MSDDPVKIMLDGMTEKPIAIPFPFSVGEYTISNPDDWHRFKRINAALESTATRLRGLLREANYFLEYVPIGIEGEEKRYHKLMSELEKELKDVD